MTSLSAIPHPQGREPEYVIFLSMENSGLATAMVVILASLVFVQSVVIAVAVVMLSRRISLLNAEVGGYVGQMKRTLEGAEKALAKALEVQTQLPVWEKRISAAMKTIVDNSREIDVYASKAVRAARTKVEAGADHSDKLLNDFSRAGYRVHKAVLHPANRISAAITALQATLGQILSRSAPRESGNHPPDQQIIL